MLRSIVNDDSGDSIKAAQHCSHRYRLSSPGFLLFFRQSFCRLAVRSKREVALHTDVRTPWLSLEIDR